MDFIHPAFGGDVAAVARNRSAGSVGRRTHLMGGDVIVEAARSAAGCAEKLVCGSTSTAATMTAMWAGDRDSIGSIKSFGFPRADFRASRPVRADVPLTPLTLVDRIAGDMAAPPEIAIDVCRHAKEDERQDRRWPAAVSACRAVVSISPAGRANEASMLRAESGGLSRVVEALPTMLEAPEHGSALCARKGHRLDFA